jgi:hypothetical protein
VAVNLKILPVLISTIFIFEVAVLYFSWRLGVANFGGIRFERSVSPKRYWSIFALHFILAAMVLTAAWLLWKRALA